MLFPGPEKFQRYPVIPLCVVNTTLFEPAHTLDAETVNDGLGKGLIVTVTGLTSYPQPAVFLIKYVPEVDTGVEMAVGEVLLMALARLVK